MKELRKPLKLCKGDTIAVVSPCHGWAGDPKIRWKYQLGVKYLQEIGLKVLHAPNALKGSVYLSENPKARAEDIMWAFENANVKAIIASVGGNDSIKIIPYIESYLINTYPKILIGYSDVMNLHILAYHCGLSSFYGCNLLSPLAEAQGWHPYSRKWFEKVLFSDSEIGMVEPSKEWTYEEMDYFNPLHRRTYYPNNGYELVQGEGTVKGRLFGGHTGLKELGNTPLALDAEDFRNIILFLEDIPEFYTPPAIEDFLRWLDGIGALKEINGIILGKANENTAFTKQKKTVRDVLSRLGLGKLPVIYGVNFGHSSPVCVLPYGAEAEINCEKVTFSILESGVL